MRLGKIRTPHFRIVIADSRSAEIQKQLKRLAATHQRLSHL
jgi:ribosomal protein S16